MRTFWEHCQAQPYVHTVTLKKKKKLQSHCQAQPYALKSRRAKDGSYLAHCQTQPCARTNTGKAKI